MKIINVSCEQFAGMRKKSVSFKDGLNIVFGPNESGKSTITNLLSKIFFQKTKIDARSDKSFKNDFFPADMRGSINTGDFIDGKVEFETKNGKFILSKEWGAEHSCRLETPNGIIKNEDKINEILKSELRYGEGVYNEMLFASQKNSDSVLQTLLDISKNQAGSKKEIIDCVSEAFAQSGNISLNDVENGINKKIAEAEGKHWDRENCMPKKRAERWSKDVGTILEAYYKLCDARERYNEIKCLENEVDNANAEFARKEAEFNEAKKKSDEFQRVKIQLIEQNARKKEIHGLREKAKEYLQKSRTWKKKEKELCSAAALADEMRKKINVDKLKKARELNSEYEELKNKLARNKFPTIEELDNLRNANQQIELICAKLSGINVTARVTMKNGHELTAAVLRTGEKIKTKGDIEINEAALFTVPGVMEMQIAPKNVDTDEIKKQFEKYCGTRDEIYKKYNISSVSDAQRLVMEFNEISDKLKELECETEQLLAEISFEELEKTYDGISVREKEAIEADIIFLCQNVNIDSFIAEREFFIEEYKSEYDSPKMLEKKAEEIETEIKIADLAQSDNITTKLPSSVDPEAYGSLLKSEEERLQNELTETARMQSEAKKLLEININTNEVSLDDVYEAERHFEEEKENLEHWIHIENVFHAQKERIQGNPTTDIAESFVRRLGMITDGRVSTEFSNDGGLDFYVFSDEKKLDYPKLSQGTKETVLLAFRLAVIEHLYPDGGATVIFDDPFTDMDATREKQAILLINEFAKKNQVIFFTCKGEYLKETEGNIIKL